MVDKKDVPRSDYSVDEILAEARVKNPVPPSGPLPSPESPVPGGPIPPGTPLPPPENSAPTVEFPRVRISHQEGAFRQEGISYQEGTSREENIARRAGEALRMSTQRMESPDMEAGEDLHSGPAPQGGPAAEPPEPKKKKRGLFGRKHRKDAEFNEEEDLYYGLQLKPLEEYRKEYEKSIRLEQSQQPESAPQSNFPYLFGRNEQEDPAVAESFERIHTERQKRLETIMRQAGLDPNEILSGEAQAAEPGGRPGKEMPPTRPDTVPAPARPEQPPTVAPGPRQMPEELPPVSEPELQPPGPPEIYTSNDPQSRPVSAHGASVIERKSAAPEVPTSQAGPAPRKYPLPQPVAVPAPAGEPVPQQGPAPEEGPIPKEEPKPEQNGRHFPPSGSSGGATPKASLSGSLSNHEAVEASPAESDSEEKISVAKYEQPGTPWEKPSEPVKEPVQKPVQRKEELPPLPPEGEPKDRPAPQYRASGILPLHVVLPELFDTLLTAEAAAYADLPPVFPEPIPFPDAGTYPGRENEPLPDEPAPGEGDGAQDDTGEEYPGFGRPLISAPQEFETGEVDLEAFAVPAPPIPLPQAGPAPHAEAPSAEAAQAAGSKKRFRLFGSEELDNEPEEAPGGIQPEELDDYTSPADAPSVLHDIVSNVRRLTLRLAVTGISTVLLLIFGLIYEHPAALTPGVHNLFSVQPFLVVNAVFVLIAALFCIPALSNGLKGLFTFQSNADTAVSLAVLAALVQNILLLILGFPSGIHLYTPLAAAALFLNTLGKLSLEKRILRNFRYVSSPGAKYAVQAFDDHNTALRLSKDFVLGEPHIAYQREAGFLKHFLRISYSPDPSDHLSQILAPAGFLLSVLLCGASAFLTHSAVDAVTVLAASLCICVPFTNMLCVNLPLSRLSRLAERNGGMVAGWAAVERFSETNAAMLDSQDLFPRGTVILNGIRTFGGQRIDDAILDAAALMYTAGGPLSDLFDQIIKSRRDILPKISEPEYRDKMGVAGTVSGRRILVGNRDLLRGEGIEPPSRDYEEKYVRGGKRIIYLASGGELMAMFIISYRSDRRRAIELRRMENNGIGLIVRTNDPNVTPAMLAECFGIDENSVRVLPEELGKVYTDLRTAPPERVNALLATKGHAAAMLRLLVGCVRQRGNISIAVALQSAGVTLGFLLVAFLSLYAGLSQLSATALLVFEAFWAAAVLLVPHIRRP